MFKVHRKFRAYTHKLLRIARSYKLHKINLKLILIISMCQMFKLSRGIKKAIQK